MNVLYAKSSRSRFTAISDLAKCALLAPVGANGVPQVYVELSKRDGSAALVARTSNPKHDTCLVLSDTEPAVLEQDFNYLISRLQSSGLEVHKGARP